MPNPALDNLQSGTRPPLRWAGSKRSQVRHLAACLPRDYGKYVEPFAGSACLFFHLGPNEAILGDLNPDLMSFYEHLAERPSSLIAALGRFAKDGEDYYDVRAKRGVPGSIAASARFLYLNRFSFNGVHRTDRHGRFNVPKGSHTGRLPSKTDILAASAAIASATRVSGDFEDTLSLASRGDFVYLDPPYARRKSLRPGEYGSRSLDGDTDLCRLACCLYDLNRRGVRYLVSYMRSRRAIQILPHTYMRYMRVRRNVGGFSSTRRTSIEVLLANYEF
jgi:DNA adenine methylase